MAEMIYLLLGSNEGERQKLLKAAAHYLVLHLARGGVVYSPVYETAAWGKVDQPPFLNMALRMDTTHPPELVLAAARQIEESMGRQRAVPWGQRTIDVDILFYGNRIVQQRELVIPHPQLQHRRFALTPMAALAPDFVHPLLHKTMSALLTVCADPLPVTIFQNETY